MSALNLWKAESGWENNSLNANLAVDKDGNIYTTNFRSIYYDLPSIPADGIVNISMNVFTEYSFRLMICGTRDSRNPMERSVQDELWRTILFHINTIPESGNIEIEPYFYWDGGDVISSNARPNQEYKIDITIDHTRRQNGEKWIGLQITDPESANNDVEFTWFDPIPESAQYLPAQIKLVFKSRRKSRNVYRTFLKDFEINYDMDAVTSGEENTETYIDQIDNSIFRISNMIINTDSLTLADLASNINVISSMTSTRVEFPIYRYNGRDIYDETDIKNLYNSEETSIMKYPDVPENIKAAADEIAQQTNSRDKIMKHLLSLCGKVTD